MSRIELHIDELILHGFPPGDRLRIAEGVERELARILGRHGLPAGDIGRREINLERLDGGAFRLSAGDRAATTGAQIARSVFAAAAPVIPGVQTPTTEPSPHRDTHP